MCQEDDGWTWQDGLLDDHSAAAPLPSGIAWQPLCDSTTGMPLDLKLVNQGREEELGWMQKMHVCDRVTRNEAIINCDGKIIGTRWVYPDKDDQVRCRLVA